jgi:hypothetical protein
MDFIFCLHGLQRFSTLVCLNLHLQCNIIYTLSLQEHKCNNTLIYYPNAIDIVDEHGFTKKKMETKGRKNSQHKLKFPPSEFT